MKLNVKIFTISFFLVTCNFLCDECGKCEGTNCNSSCCLYEVTKDITKIDGTTNENGDEVCLQFKVKPNHWYEYKMDYDKEDETFQNIERSFFYGARKKDPEGKVLSENKISNFNPLLACSGEDNIHLYFAPIVINDEPLSEDDEDSGGFSEAKYTFTIKEINGVNEGTEYCKKHFNILPLKSYHGKVGPIRDKFNKTNRSFYSFLGTKYNRYRIFFQNLNSSIKVITHDETYSTEDETFVENPELLITVDDHYHFENFDPGFIVQSNTEKPATYQISIEDLGPVEP